MPEKPVLLVIFGVTGDLSRRKLLPALYNLARGNLLPEGSRIIGVTRQKLTTDQVLEPLNRFAHSHARASEVALNKIKQSFELFSADLADGKDYKLLKKQLDKIELKAEREFQRLYYLSVPPAVFDEVVGFMGEAELHKQFLESPEPALLVEKPFGYDMVSAKELIKSSKQYFTESQIYRIDHYLAKEMAQNILDFRASNPLFLAIWDREHIEKIIITAHEQIGIEGRAAFYEQTGALRDLIQSHLLQLLALTAMEIPRAMAAVNIRAARRELLESIVPMEPYEVARLARRGQYEGYRQEVDDDETSTETYARVELKVDNPRWKDIPFVLRTGKSTPEKRTDIAVHIGQNVLTMQLQPDEAIGLRLLSKKPGHGHETAEVLMDFDYKRSYPGISSPEAYERVLLDAARQDLTLFASSEEVLAAWRIITPILDEWAKTSDDLVIYPKNSLPFEDD